MTSGDILEMVNHPDVPKFIFGSQELSDWTRKHRNPKTCQCEKFSGLYVVTHRSLNPQQTPDFRVLSCWNYGALVPHSWDVPAMAS